MSLKYELDNLALNAKEWYYIKTDIRGTEIQSLGYHSSAVVSLSTDKENDTLKLLAVDGSTHIIPISKIVRVEYK
jgi:ABC-type phosphate transport system auxiliary subunit